MSRLGEGEPMLPPQITPENMSDLERIARINELETERESLIQTIADLTSKVEGLTGRVQTLETGMPDVALVQPAAPLNVNANNTLKSKFEDFGNRNRGRVAKLAGGLAVAAGVALAVAGFTGNNNSANAQETTPTATATETPKATATPTATPETTPTPAATPAPEKTKRQKLQDRIEHADTAKGVPFTVKRANPNKSNMKTIVRELVDGENVKKADTRKGAWNSLRIAIKSADVTAPQALVGVGLGAEANKAVAVGTANMLNHKDIDTPSNMTHKEALDSIVRDLTKKSTKASLTTISGTQNHGFKDGRVFEAGVSSEIKVLKVTVDGKASYFKIICLNGQDTLVPYNPPTPETSNPTGGGDTGTPDRTPPSTDRKPPRGGGQTGTTQKPEDQPCPTGYVEEQGKCLHPKAAGPPEEANQKPRPKPGTPGYKPGNAEGVDGTQHGDQDNLNPTEHGTEAGGPGSSPGGGDGSVVASPGAGAPANPEHTGGASGGTSEGTNDGANDPQTQTGGTGQTNGAGSAPNGH